MKKLTTIACVLTMLLVLTAVASASAGEEPLVFTIHGTTTDPGTFEEKGPCKVKFKGLIAAGNVTGDLTGSFTFVEEGKGDQCKLTGSTTGIMTIVTSSGEIVVIEFKGKVGPPTDPLQPPTVQGKWKIEGGTGTYAGSKGKGTYSGSTIDPFEVMFNGSIRTHSD